MYTYIMTGMCRVLDKRQRGIMQGLESEDIQQMLIAETMMKFIKTPLLDNDALLTRVLQNIYKDWKQS